MSITLEMIYNLKTERMCWVAKKLELFIYRFRISFRVTGWARVDSFRNRDRNKNRNRDRNRHRKRKKGD